MAAILVIDDEDLVVLMLKRLLEKAGHQVTTASNGNLGLKAFQEHNPDLVVTDLIMPEKEGIETIMELRQIQPDIKIIAISGGGGYGKPEDYLPVAKGLGADRVFSKPFDEQEFLSAIEQLTTLS